MERMISLRLSTELVEQLAVQAKARGWSRSDLIRRVLTQFCERQEMRR